MKRKYDLAPAKCTWVASGALAFGPSLFFVGGVELKTARGCVYVFDRKSGKEVRVLRVRPSAGGDEFGHSIAVSKTYVAVGAPGLAAPRRKSTGIVVIYDLATGRRLQTLAPPVDSSGAQFGFCVACCGDKVVVGAPSRPKAQSPGAAFVYDVRTGQMLGMLSGAKSSKAEKFGCSVAISARWIVVGAPSEDSDAYPGSASAYDSRTLEPLGKLVSGNGPSFDAFGEDVKVVFVRPSTSG